MPSGTIVDSRSINEETLLMEYFMSPYFAWGPEYIVAQFQPDGSIGCVCRLAVASPSG